jgi:hypothetical protein
MVLDCFFFCGDAMAVFLPQKMGMDNVLSILGLHNQFELPRSPLAEVNHLHVIFDLNGVLVAKRTSSFHTQMNTNSMFTFKFRLKDFLTSCLSQFEVKI